MPATILGEILLQGLCYGTAKLLLPRLSAGKLRVEPGPNGESVPAGWKTVSSRLPDGTILLSADAGTLIGIVWWAAVIVGAVLLWPE